MRIINKNLIYSPSDLVLFAESPFASWMEHYSLLEPEINSEKDSEDEVLSVLQEKGATHEAEVLAEFEAQNKTIKDIAKEPTANKQNATIEAMRAGYDIIYQGYLRNDHFQGYADFLLKVEGESNWGDYTYEVWDTKLSKFEKNSFTIQLCAYQDMLQEIQGTYAEYFVVVLGNKDKIRYRTDDFFAYYSLLRNKFLAYHSQFDMKKKPNPADSKSWGNWEEHANDILKQADHLIQVATITRSQIKKLNEAGISTMQGLAETNLDKVRKLPDETLRRLKKQAALQVASLGKDIPEYEIIIPAENEKIGLALLPPHSKNDLFFDIEGYPLVDGGLEYLWGSTYFNHQGERCFKDFWAHNREQEKQAFEAFINWAFALWREDPSMHIYHYASYEITACKKLMSRYAICEDKVDQLLRNEVFVDLYKIVKNGLLLGEPRYSIKNVEHLFRAKRQTEVGSGGDSIVVYENWTRNPDGDTWKNSKILKDIRDYNIDDCESTQELVVWLRNEQEKQTIAYLGKTELTELDVKEEIQEKNRLRDDLLEFSAQQEDENQASIAELFAYCLDFHRRESKPIFWRLFERLGLVSEDLLEDVDCIANCVQTDREPFKKTERARNLIYEYQFDINQEFRNKMLSTYYILGLEDDNENTIKATVEFDHSDLSTGLIALNCKIAPPHCITLVPNEYVNPNPIPKAIQELAEEYLAGELNETALIDFLSRSFPKIKNHQKASSILNPESADKIPAIISVVENLDHSYLTIQGPPGAGKTFTAKHIIAALLRNGKKLAISSNSHKAINNLLISAAQYCQKEDINAYFACTKETDDEINQLGIGVLKNNEIRSQINSACVIGATAWGFSREDLIDQFDYLFIDEAGQVSVANLIAMSRCAKNIVIMGDQMQLGQPTQATHPGDSACSILDYLMGDTPTISSEMGIFLDTSYRMHSAINAYISKSFYEGKLKADKSNDLQEVKVPKHYQGAVNKSAGIIFIPVTHEGNAQASDEEVEAIHKLTKKLIGRDYIDKQGNQHKISQADIIYLAPYNQQVNQLRMALGEDAKVGSVDKFQGQEAPIVILSMCSSDANESARGIDFLFDKNRLNVAISRAQALVIVVSNPNLLLSVASTIEQQKKINSFCELFLSANAKF